MVLFMHLYPDSFRRDVVFSVQFIQEEHNVNSHPIVGDVNFEYIASYVNYFAPQ